MRRLLVVEDQGALRALLSAHLQQQGFTVVATSSAAEAVEAFAEFDPDALIADIDLGTRPDGVELALLLRRMAPHLGVVFLSSYPRSTAGKGVFGIEGAVFLSKTSLESPDELVAAIEQTLGSASVPEAAAVAAVTQGPERLTRHQLEVLGMVARGWSNEQIATESGSTVRAVERSMSRIFERLEVTGDPSVSPRVAAAARYISLFGPVR